MNPRFYYLIFWAIISAQSISAQTTYEEFKKKAVSDFQDYKSQRQQEYDVYRRECNRRYAEFMRAGWEQKNGENPVVQPKKDEVPPVVFDDDTPIDSEPLPVVEIVLLAPQPIPQPAPIAPIEEKPQPEIQALDFAFYGTSCQIRISQEQRVFVGSCNEAAFADAWERYSTPEYDNMLFDCLALREKLRLNDYTYLLLLDKFTSDLFGGHGNNATFLAAYIYCQSGYKVRLAYSDDNLYLLFACNDILFNRPYFVLNAENYFSFSADISEGMHICPADMKSNRQVSMSIMEQPRLAVDLSSERKLGSKRYNDVEAKVRINLNLIEFYNNYPVSMSGNNMLTKWALYADISASEEMKTQLYPALQSVLDGLGEQDKVERLLNFVQTAFVYEYDDNVWGGDRVFFAEETLYYPYADCEDRSILFSRLVRDLVGLDVALIYYPGHLAVAVHFDMPVKGDYIVIDGTNYTVCDPTYINAPVGATMPQMNNSEARAILLKSQKETVS